MTEWLSMYGIDEGPGTGNEVRLTIPPNPEYLRTARLVAADAAVRAGLDVDEVEDFKIAVDELTNWLMAATDADVRIAFLVVGACVMGKGVATRREGGPPSVIDDFSRTILSSVADHYDTEENDTGLSFGVMKRASAVAARP